MSAEEPSEAAKLKELWKEVRAVLKAGLLAGEIPLDPKAVKPKQVYQKYIDLKISSFEQITYGDKFTRMLRTLRQKHNDGDLENEDKRVIEWGKSAAKHYLKKCFREGIIKPDYGNPEQIWNDYCKGRKEFARMKYDAAFVRRLKSVCEDFMKKAKRRDADLVAFNIAQKNHPTPELNHRGEPQWNGSEAQKLLREDIKNGRHEGKAPKALWEGPNKKAYQIYSLQTFRDHIYQEQRLIKFQNYCNSLKEKKIEKLQY